MGTYRAGYSGDALIFIRPLKDVDICSGQFAHVLSQLSPVTSSEVQLSILNDRRNRDGINTLVALVDDRVVGTASYYTERKFTYGGKLVGRIEEVVVDRAHRLKGVGRALVLFCLEELKSLGCRKVQLDCNDENVGFYVSCGFGHSSNSMRLDFK